mmetsp:Transcript_13228/g.15178  ORF Transcript_13228/g.15178 Transcript_13228/m.15178 type:complete len:109 (+) Transcript_13228:425-751(+)
MWGCGHKLAFQTVTRYISNSIFVPLAPNWSLEPKSSPKEHSNMETYRPTHKDRRCRCLEGGTLFRQECAHSILPKGASWWQIVPPRLKSPRSETNCNDFATSNGKQGL